MPTSTAALLPGTQEGGALVQTVWQHAGMNLPGYMTIAQVAERLGVTADTVSAYKHRGQMPAPDATVGQSPLWLVQTIEDWIPTRVGRGRKQPAPAAPEPAPKPRKRPAK